MPEQDWVATSYDLPIAYNFRIFKPSSDEKRYLASCNLLMQDRRAIQVFHLGETEMEANLLLQEVLKIGYCAIIRVNPEPMPPV